MSTCFETSSINHSTFSQKWSHSTAVRSWFVEYVANMFLTFLLLFLKTLDNIELENNAVDNEPNFQPNVHFKNSVSNQDTRLQDGQLPDLVPLEFPKEFYENGAAVDVLNVVKKKLENFFGETMTEEMMKVNSSDGVFDYLAKADFQNYWINSIVNNVGETLKSKESPLTGISNKKQCRKVCRKNQSGIFRYLEASIQNIVSSVTKEDFRFEFSQDPKKSYTFTLDEQANKYQCKCIDEGYIIKVSPRLKELMEKKFIKQGKPLSEIILEENPEKEVTHFEDFMSWRKMTNLGLYLTGWKSRAKRDVDDDIGEFIVYHGLIAALLFVFCHCLFYIYIIYVFFIFLSNFVL